MGIERTLSRRDLLAAAGGLLAAGPALAKPAPARDKNAFAFVTLGDLHFDRLAHHNMPWLEQEHPGDVHQVQNYSQLTGSILPRLFPEVREQVRTSPVPMPFTLHVGDLVEGLCGSGDLARTQCQEAVRFVKDAGLGHPFVMTKGNHDVTGPGSVEAYNELVLPFTTAPAQSHGPAGSWSMRQGDAQFLFFDAYSPESLAWLERTAEKRDARHLIVVIHPPVVPYGARSRWHIFANARQAEQRKRLLDLLGRHSAIVLSGHLHKYGCVVRKTDTGRFVQLAISSIIQRADTTPRQERAGLEQYGPDLVQLEPNFDPKSEADRRLALTEEKPHLLHFEYADAAGYAVVSVDGADVKAEIYNGIGNRLWKTLDLTGLLRA